MSNIQKYNDIVAFHPGYYINEIIEDMGITQEEFATRLGTTPKTVSKLVNGECNLSNDLIQKLSSMFGFSIEFWFNLQNKYEWLTFQILKITPNLQRKKLFFYLVNTLIFRIIKE